MRKLILAVSFVLLSSVSCWAVDEYHGFYMGMEKDTVMSMIEESTTVYNVYKTESNQHWFQWELEKGTGDYRMYYDANNRLIKLVYTAFFVIPDKKEDDAFNPYKRESPNVRRNLLFSQEIDAIKAQKGVKVNATETINGVEYEVYVGGNSEFYIARYKTTDKNEKEYFVFSVVFQEARYCSVPDLIKPGHGNTELYFQKRKGEFIWSEPDDPNIMAVAGKRDHEGTNHAHDHMITFFGRNGVIYKIQTQNAAPILLPFFGAPEDTITKANKKHMKDTYDEAVRKWSHFAIVETKAVAGGEKQTLQCGNKTVVIEYGVWSKGLKQIVYFKETLEDLAYFTD